MNMGTSHSKDIGHPQLGVQYSLCQLVNVLLVINELDIPTQNEYSLSFIYLHNRILCHRNTPAPQQTI